MGKEGTRFLCCTCKTWINLIAGLVIVGSVIEGILETVGYCDAIQLITKDHQAAVVAVLNEKATRIFAVRLGFVVMHFVLAVVLLVGNIKERVGLLWTWLILAVISILCSNLCVVILDMIQVTYGHLADLIVRSLIVISLSGCLFYVIRHRVQDITKGQQSSATIM